MVLVQSAMLTRLVALKDDTMRLGVWQKRFGQKEFLNGFALCSTQRHLMRRRKHKSLKETLVRRRALTLAFKLIRRRPIGVPGHVWPPMEGREVYRNGYQPRQRHMAFEVLRLIRVVKKKE